MPTITVAYWNVENFGTAANGKRGNYLPLCGFITQAMVNMGADILCLMEMKPSALVGPNPLALLQETLEAAMPGCSWYYDWIPGALNSNSVPDYATFFDLAFTQQARNEGYAIFWKQNIAKFIMQHADDIDSPTVGGVGVLTANTQSGTVRAKAIVGGAFPVPTYGIALPGNVLVPLAAPGGAPVGWQAYTLPIGTTPPGGAAITDPVGAPLVAAGAAALAAPLFVPAGSVLPVGTTIGANGVQLNALVNGASPIVIPGNFVLTDPLTLPAGGVTLVPEHMLSLVLTGRPAVGGVPVPFVPAGANAWQLLNFVDGLGAVYNHPHVTRRPAYCTILANIAGAALANRLIPITVYHTPLNALPLTGMGRGALCRSLYQAFDHAGAAYIDNTRSVIGGDFNQDVDENAGHFTIYTDTFANGGADCNTGGVANIRANLAYPGGGLGFPDYPALPVPPYAPAPGDNPVNRSTILLINDFFTNLPVLSNQEAHYRRSSYDNVFYRGFTPAQAPMHALGSMYDLMQAVLGIAGPQIPLATVQLFQNLPIFNPIPGAGIGSVVHPATLFADILAGTFAGAGPAAGAGPFAGALPIPGNVTAARRAAEFIRLFVSDHFPILFEMQF